MSYFILKSFDPFLWMIMGPYRKLWHFFLLETMVPFFIENNCPFFMSNYESLVMGKYGTLFMKNTFFIKSMAPCLWLRFQSLRCTVFSFSDRPRPQTTISRVFSLPLTFGFVYMTLVLCKHEKCKQNLNIQFRSF